MDTDRGPPAPRCSRDGCSLDPAPKSWVPPEAAGAHSPRGRPGPPLRGRSRLVLGPGPGPGGMDAGGPLPARPPAARPGRTPAARLPLRAALGRSGPPDAVGAARGPARRARGGRAAARRAGGRGGGGARAAPTNPAPRRGSARARRGRLGSERSPSDLRYQTRARTAAKRFVGPTPPRLRAPSAGGSHAQFTEGETESQLEELGLEGLQSPTPVGPELCLPRASASPSSTRDGRWETPAVTLCAEWLLDPRLLASRNGRMNSCCSGSQAWYLSPVRRGVDSLTSPSPRVTCPRQPRKQKR